jgi:hypothetical protein
LKAGSLVFDKTLGFFFLDNVRKRLEELLWI